MSNDNETGKNSAVPDITEHGPVEWPGLNPKGNKRYNFFALGKTTLNEHSYGYQHMSCYCDTKEHSP